MKNKMNPICCGLLLLGFVIALSTGLQAAENDYTLLLQSSPPDGGTVAPGVGIHQIQIGQTVNLSAKPKKGYRFMYWLGDVSQTSGVNTTISVDSPKLVIAVFSREDFGRELPSTGIIDGQAGGGGGGGGSNPIQSSGSGGGGGGGGSAGSSSRETANTPFPVVPRIPDVPIPPVDPPDDPSVDEDDIPVPGDGDIPVPGDGEVPEPATVALLGLGGLLLRLRKK